MSLITDLSSLIKRFGQWIQHFFAAAEIIYNEYAPFVQDAAKQAGVVVSAVSQFINGSEASAFIKKIFPNIDLTVIQGITDKVLAGVNWVPENVPLTADDALAELSKYLNQFEGDYKIQHTQAVANLFTKELSADNTLDIQKLIATSELNYQANVKPVVDAALAA